MRFGWTILLLAALLAGCSKPAAPADTLRVGIGAEAATLDPAKAQGVAEMRVLSALYEGLVLPYPDGGSPVSPGVAERWETSDGGRTIVFYLRPNACWSDGKPITAQDFVRSWRRALEPTTAAPNAGLFDAIAGAKAFREGLGKWEGVGIRAPDARRLEVRLERPTPTFLQTLCHPVFYPVREGKGNAKSLVGNGPFRLAGHRSYEKLVVERSENYRGEKTPTLRRIEFYPIDNRASEEMAFLSGALDVTMSLPLNKVEAYRRDPRLRMDPALQVEYVLINTRRSPFDNVTARRALSEALDRAGLCKAVLRAGQTPALRLVPPGCGLNGKLATVKDEDAPLKDDAPLAFSAPLLREDASAAKREWENLTAAEREAFARAVYRFNSSEARKAVAEALQAQWQKNLGVMVGLENLEWKTFLDARAKGDYTLARAGWSADVDDPANFLELFVSDNPNNTTGWGNASYDALVRARRFEEAEAILMAELPCIPLYLNPNVYLLSPRVQGWEANPLDRHDWRQVRVSGYIGKSR